MSQLLDLCIPSNPDISGIGVRAAIYAQNFLSFAPVVVHLWDRKVTKDEVQSMEGQSVGILSIAFAILISTVIQAKSSVDGLTSFHAAVILDLSWMNNTSTFIWFLLYAHHRSKTEKRSEFVQATWSAWGKALFAPIYQLVKQVEDEKGGDGKTRHEGERSERRSSGVRRRKKQEAGVTVTHKLLPGFTDVQAFIRRAWRLVSQSPVLTLGSIHLTLMAAIGIWLWSNPATFGFYIPCDPTLAVVGAPIHFSSTALRICSLLMYSLLLIPGLNLIIPFLFFLAPHILYNASRRQHPQFWAGCRRILDTLHRKVVRMQRIPYGVFRRQCASLSDQEAGLVPQSTMQNAQLPSSPLDIHTTFLVVGLACLASINAIFLVDIELTLSRNKQIQSQGEGMWGFGQVLALLLLVVPLRDFVSSIVDIRRRLRKEKQLRDTAQKNFEDSLRHAIEENTFEGHDFEDLIERGANPNTRIQGRLPYHVTAHVTTLFQAMIYNLFPLYSLQHTREMKVS
jgi:hypothetical protein